MEEMGFETVEIDYEDIYRCLRDEQPEILMSDEMIEAAKRPIVRMLDMSRQLGIIK